MKNKKQKCKHKWKLLHLPLLQEFQWIDVIQHHHICLRCGAKL